ncbi:DUF5330 domain-containing protein [Bartonella tamiae]|uniref:DUF5330 domain-containing protein n=1 Tax=Bartonella tamiae Th239 TaxID=1094558 RepID=J0QX05_9HYPH|nr:DUF5330 domain-containing protein [Bartonella tamiae]EJF90571.1 hypothetical protein ME5_00972 [Bartonella tamiae Th239]EJF94051.1 hypothetical protein MEG_00909 [Bartonella tamiae Th307]
MIRFLFKSAFFIALLLIVISFFGPKTPSDMTNQAQSTNPISAFIALKDTLSDLGGFCDRNATTCETGKTFLGSLSARAKDGAKIAYDYIGSTIAKEDANPSVEPHTIDSSFLSSSHQNNQNINHDAASQSSQEEY